MPIRLFLFVLMAFFCVSGAFSWNYYRLTPDQISGAISYCQNNNIAYFYEKNASVDFGNFSQAVEIPVKQLETRLDEKDPRWDPYLQTIKEIFSSNDGLVPLWSKTPLPNRNKKENVGASFPLLRPFTFFLLFILVIYFKRPRKVRLEKKIIYWAVSLFWILFSFFAAGPDIIWFIGYAGALLVFSQADKGKYLPWKIYFVPLIIGIFEWLLLTQSIQLRGIIALSICSYGFLLFCYFYSKYRADELKQVEHSLLEIVLLKKKRFKPELKTYLFIALMTVFSILFTLTTSNLISTTQTLSADIYWHHRWYQEAVTYGKTWDDFSKSKEVNLKNYSWKNTKLIETSEIVLVDDNSWRSNILKDVTSQNIAQVWLQAP